MEKRAQELLDEAVVTALAEGDSYSAYQLLDLLYGKKQDRPQLPPAPEAPKLSLISPPGADLSLAEGSVIDDDDHHDYHWWAAQIRDAFVPSLLRQGRTTFTSGEVYTFFESIGATFLTNADLFVTQNGRERWKNALSNAMSWHDRAGATIKRSGLFGKRWEVCVSAITPAPSIRVPGLAIEA